MSEDLRYDGTYVAQGEDFERARVFHAMEVSLID